MPTFRMLTISASALAMMFVASSAGAQDYGSNREVSYSSGPTEEVITRGPRLHIQRGHLNAPDERVSLSQEVRYDDLDLRTPAGKQELKLRVHYAARAVCEQLENFVPYEMPGSPSCYRTALENATHHVNDAIQVARDREYADAGWR